MGLGWPVKNASKLRLDGVTYPGRPEPPEFRCAVSPPPYASSSRLPWWRGCGCCLIRKRSAARPGPARCTRGGRTRGACRDECRHDPTHSPCLSHRRGRPLRRSAACTRACPANSAGRTTGRKRTRQRWQGPPARTQTNCSSWHPSSRPTSPSRTRWSRILLSDGDPQFLLHLGDQLNPLNLEQLRRRGAGPGGPPQHRDDGERVDQAGDGTGRRPPVRTRWLSPRHNDIGQALRAQGGERDVQRDRAGIMDRPEPCTTAPEPPRGPKRREWSTRTGTGD